MALLDLEQLQADASEFERLGSMMGHLKRLIHEKEENLENITKAQERLGYLEIEIQGQAKAVKRQLQAIKRNPNG